LISGLSLCLLCRTHLWWLAALAGVIAIASKFSLRWRGKHLFNPTNIALAVLMLVSDGRVWVSPGQWGSAAFFAFLMACLGGLVVMRAGRADVALAFLASWILLITGRSLWLHEPLAIPMHRLQNGALLLFTFFMISDPRTTPDSRAGRIVFAMMVAVGGWWWQFRMFGTNGPLWALAVFSMLTPLIDVLLPGPRYQWHRHVKPRFSHENETHHPAAGSPDPAVPC
jgi:Na+-transporting NADH:ubiquinone oxidoreductase subunit NqrB